MSKQIKFIYYSTLYIIHPIVLMVLYVNEYINIKPE